MSNIEEELMNDDLTKITLTFPMRYDTPNRNGTIYTKEAIEHAFASSNPHMPILMQCDKIRDEVLSCHLARCIGFTDPTYYFDCDDKNKVCNVTLTGHVFDMDAEIVINEMHDGKVTDFESDQSAY